MSLAPGGRELEAVVLAGGASRRMGLDKSRLLVAGEPLLERIVRLLLEAGIPTTVLGGRAVSGAGFQPDSEAGSGPLAALSAFVPTAPKVFVASCDLPRFHGGVAEALAHAIGHADAAVPVLDGRIQPLCAAYRSSALESSRALCASGESRVQVWLDTLRVEALHERRLTELGLDPNTLRGANTPEEWTLIGDVQEGNG